VVTEIQRVKFKSDGVETKICWASQLDWNAKEFWTEGIQFKRASASWDEQDKQCPPWLDVWEIRSNRVGHISWVTQPVRFRKLRKCHLISPLLVRQTKHKMRFLLTHCQWVIGYTFSWKWMQFGFQLVSFRNMHSVFLTSNVACKPFDLRRASLKFHFLSCYYGQISGPRWTWYFDFSPTKRGHIWQFWLIIIL